ncbi:Methyltransferase domain-containing protein [Streptoalloteichus tenebrarius]|uniref:Methyltransferase domain-containing protein n=1 Tax=Streptoalloteichus tenebrarius (strain ATCC 17920 / DSM 40477 / JCM 4838 / CBS 697.72 / NBRC 16177 / NCIMB 11028 / NRRL B-12390 / A12253. 1 / ISP 5477) TaxID=1933 RepID=A0ABT1I3X5_STRSD|nr:Methyltransferase domain-containing protein [Streptoalloteichus tenebrarius]BFE99664.1 class I SAM-dependent methyltransferase [Streptoalloteichus tenebrarius]
MTRVPEEDAPATTPLPDNNYDSFAEAYSAEDETSLNNAYYERPATLALAGDVTGRRILDAGCGSGPLFAALRDRGAIVTGIDASAGMVEQARRRLGDDADPRVADLADPLPFPDDSFDDVIASLVLHYLWDWGADARRDAARAEDRRPAHRLGEPPTVEYCLERLSGRRPDYFATSSRTEEWTLGGRTRVLRFWNRPLHAMTDAFISAGFRIRAISEPQPVPAARELFPDDFLLLSTAPSFLFFVLQAE